VERLGGAGQGGVARDLACVLVGGSAGTHRRGGRRGERPRELDLRGGEAVAGQEQHPLGPLVRTPARDDQQATRRRRLEQRSKPRLLLRVDDPRGLDAVERRGERRLVRERDRGVGALGEIARDGPRGARGLIDQKQRRGIGPDEPPSLAQQRRADLAPVAGSGGE